MRNKILIGRIHILWRGRYLLLMERSIQVWGVRQIGVMTVKGVRVGIALQHPEEAVGEQWRGVVVLMRLRMECV